MTIKTLSVALTNSSHKSKARSTRRIQMPYPTLPPPPLRALSRSHLSQIDLIADLEEQIRQMHLKRTAERKEYQSLQARVDKHTRTARAHRKRKQSEERHAREMELTHAINQSRVATTPSSSSNPLKRSRPSSPSPFKSRSKKMSSLSRSSAAVEMNDPDDSLFVPSNETLTRMPPPPTPRQRQSIKTSSSPSSKRYPPFLGCFVTVPCFSLSKREII